LAYCPACRHQLDIRVCEGCGAPHIEAPCHCTFGTPPWSEPRGRGRLASALPADIRYNRHVKIDRKTLLDPTTGPGFVLLGVAVVLVAAAVISVVAPLRSAARDVATFRMPVWAFILAAAIGAMGFYTSMRAVLSRRPPPAQKRTRYQPFTTPRMRRWGVDWEAGPQPTYVEGPFCPHDGAPLWQSGYAGPRSPHESSISPGNPWRYAKDGELRFECMACRKEYDISGHGDMGRLLNELATVSQARPCP